MMNYILNYVFKKCSNQILENIDNSEIIIMNNNSISIKNAIKIISEVKN
jgi:hypothetical protein